jgi:hypothetical protein
MDTQIVVREIVFGEHYYPGAVLKRIARPHQHEFGVLIVITEKKPREIEWIQLKEDLYNFILDHWPIVMKNGGKFLNFGPLSCEEIAVEIAKYIARLYVRPVSVQVDEMDEQCGAKVTFTELEVKELAKQNYLPIANEAAGAYTT